MKYTVFGFNQQKLVDYGLDMIDAGILRWYVDFYQTDAMVKIPVKGMPDHVWVKFAKIAEDLPTIGFTDIRQITKRFDKFCTNGVMSKTKVHTQHGAKVGFYLHKMVLDELLRKPDKKNTATALNVSPGELEKLQTTYLKGDREKPDFSDCGTLPFDDTSDNSATAEFCSCENPQQQKSVVAQQQKSVVATVNSSTIEFKKEAAAADFSENNAGNMLFSLEKLEKTYNQASLFFQELTDSFKNIKNELKTSSATAEFCSCENPQQQKSVVAQLQKKVVAKSIKSALQDISSELVFDEQFYNDVAAFLEINTLDETYLQWIWEYVKSKKDIQNVRSFFYKIYNASDILELYKNRIKEEQKKTEARQIICPVCAKQFDRISYLSCPECGLAQSDFENERKVARLKKIMQLPPEKSKAMEKERMQAYRDARQQGSFAPAREILAAIDKKYGIPEYTENIEKEPK
jgi:uncharacterized CHY-type Zn-finger protein